MASVLIKQLRTTDTVGVASFALAVRRIQIIISNCMRHNQHDVVTDGFDDLYVNTHCYAPHAYDKDVRKEYTRSYNVLLE